MTGNEFTSFRMQVTETSSSFFDFNTVFFFQQSFEIFHCCSISGTGHYGIPQELLLCLENSHCRFHLSCHDTRAVLSGVHYGDGVAIRAAAARNNVTMLTSLDTVSMLLDVLEGETGDTDTSPVSPPCLLLTLCNLLRAVLIPKYSRRHLLDLFEDFAEVTLRRKVNILCDLLQRVVGIHQEVCGTKDTLLVDIVLEALACLFSEEF